MAARLTRRGSLVAASVLLAGTPGLLLTACGGSLVGGSPVPSVAGTPGAATGPDVDRARTEVVRALGGFGLVVQEPQVSFRPAEASALASAPRLVLQVILPEEPGHGFVSIYQFPDTAAASTAAREQAAYLATGPGRVQFPPDTRFTVRLLGSTVVFYAWSPANSADPRAPDIETALRAVGTEIEVPR